MRRALPWMRRLTWAVDATSPLPARQGRLSTPSSNVSSLPDELRDGEIAISYFATVNSTKPEAARHTWPELVPILTTHARLPRKDAGRLFSPVEYDPGHTRAKGDGPREVTLAVTDHDHGDDPEVLRNCLDGLAFAIYSTHSHTTEDPRLRAVVRLAEPVPVGQWPEFWARWCLFLEARGCHPDRACPDAKRMYYLPAAPPDAEVYAAEGHGDALTMDILPELPPKSPKATPRSAGTRASSASGRYPADKIVAKYIDLAGLGNRNKTGMDLAVQLQRNLYTEAEAEGFMLDYQRAVELCGDHPYTASEALETLRGIYSTPATGDPWTLPGSGDSDQRMIDVNAGTTHDNGAGQPEGDDSMDALTQARETIDAAIEAGTASAVLDDPDVLKALAALAPGERSDRQQAIKKAIPAIDLRELKAAIPSAKNAGNGTGRTAGDDSMEARAQARERTAATIEAGTEDEAGIKIKHFRQSDSGNAELFATIHRNDVRYMHGQYRWLVWRGHWWQDDTNGEVVRMAKECARTRYRLTWDQIQDETGRKAEIAHALRSEQSSGIANMLKQARAEHPVTVGSDELDKWDSDPWLIAVDNGIVDLRTGALRPGKREDCITLHLPFRYEPEATCPRWTQFIAEVMDGDPEMIAYLQRQVGYSLTGLTSEQVWWLLYGKGANGKSVFLETLTEAFAPLAFTTPFATFEAQRGAAIPNDLAALAGRRLVTASETNENAKFNEARIKSVVHGGRQSARFLNKEYFTFNSQVKLWLGVNHKPSVADDSKGFWRSVHMIPFTRTFDGADADPHLKDTLLLEAPGIFVWAVRGCLEWQRIGGLKPPALVTAATEEYRREADPLSEFISDTCMIGPDYRATASKLLEAYNQWAEAQNLRKDDRLNGTSFGCRLKDRDGIRKEHTRTGAMYYGIGLKTDLQEVSDVD